MKFIYLVLFIYHVQSCIFVFGGMKLLTFKDVAFLYVSIDNVVKIKYYDNRSDGFNSIGIDQDGIHGEYYFVTNRSYPKYITYEEGSFKRNIELSHYCTNNNYSYNCIYDKFSTLDYDECSKMCNYELEYSIYWYEKVVG